MKVADVMTRNVASVRRNETCGAAVQRMWDYDCGALPVLDDEGAVVGMLTDRDVCISAWMQARPPQEIFVSEAMSPGLYSCSAGDSIVDVESVMQAKQVRRLPVLDGRGRLEGIVSLADIARRGVQARGGPEAHEITQDEIAATLATICEPRVAGTI
jgi:CBS-domain-containing membrane protein